jgi:ProP effector
MDLEACTAALKQRFPALFTGGPRPIKLRIQADIQERAPGVFTRQSLSAFLRRYTGSTSYLIALGKASHRFDLDGQPAGEIAAEHHEAAREELTRRRGLRREREEAALQGQREQQRLEEQGRRDRAQLLRAFESSTLTKANFCALKGVAAEQLDGLLAQARQEAASWAAARPPRQDERQRDPRGPRPGDPRGDRRDGPRGPRPDGPPGRRIGGPGSGGPDAPRSGRPGAPGGGRGDGGGREGGREGGRDGRPGRGPQRPDNRRGPAAADAAREQRPPPVPQAMKGESTTGGGAAQSAGPTIDRGADHSNDRPHTPRSPQAASRPTPGPVEASKPELGAPEAGTSADQNHKPGEKGQP